MRYLVVFFIVNIILALIILLLKFKVVIKYTKKEKDDQFVLSIFTLGGIIKMKYEIPVVDIEKKGFLIKKIKRKKNIVKDTDKDKERIKFSDLPDKIEHFYNLLKYNKLFIKKLYCYIKKRILIKDIKFNIRMGVGDAAYTAVIYGMAWSIAGVIFSYLLNNFNIKKHTFEIKANFMEKMFNIDLYCIFTVRLVHIIVVGLKIYFHRRKSTRRKRTCRPVAA